MIGPNGAGKSTLFKLIASFLKPTAGQVLFNGERISGQKPHLVAQKGVVRTFQETTVFKEMTALENVVVAHHMRLDASLPGVYFATPTARADERRFRDSAAEILDYLDLGHVAHEKAKNLPHGYLRALGIALAMAAEPKILLLDEPFAGMNPEEKDRAVEHGPRHPRPRHHRAAGRARHAVGDADQRPRRRHQLRHQDRRGHARRGPAQRRRHRGLSRPRGRGAGALSEESGACTSTARTSRSATTRSTRCDGVSLELEQGEIVALIGANGAGKTTTLRAITGLRRPWRGEIWFEGERIDQLPPAAIVARGIAMVPEGRRIYPYMTVKDNLLMGAYLRRDKAGIRPDLEKVYVRFPRVKERLRQQAGTLSGGEQEMVVVGRALMARPKLLLLDEPSLGLAPWSCARSPSSSPRSTARTRSRSSWSSRTARMALKV